MTWTGANGTGVWSDSGNWSSGIQPVAGDSAIFDGTSAASCLIDVNPVNVTLQIAAGYAGTVTQGTVVTAAAFNQANGSFVQGDYSLTLTGNLTFSGGTFQGGSNSITAANFVQSGGSFTSTSGTMILTAGTYASPFQITAGTFIHHNGTVRLTKAGGHVRAGGNSLNHLTCDGDDAQLDAPLTLAGNLTTKSFICWGYALAVAGNVSAPNWLYADTMTFNGSDAQTLDAPAVYSGPIIVDKPGGTLSIVNHNASLSSGVSLILAQGNLDFGGRTVTVGGNFTNCGGTLNLSGGVLNVAGTFSNTGTASVGAGTVNLTGGSQVILGTSIFNNLAKTVSSGSTLTFPAGLTQTVTGSLSLQGAYGNLLSLRSSSEGTRWLLDAQGSRNIAFLDVRDSYNIHSAYVAAYGTGSTDSGNNINWLFTLPTPTATSTGTSTATPTWTSTMTPTISPTATPSQTPSPTSTTTPTPTSTASPTATSSTTTSATPTLTRTPSISSSPTETFTPTSTPSLTVTASHTRTLTCTASATASETLAYAVSALGRMLAAPVPVRVGTPLRLYFDKTPRSGLCRLYNLSGERAAEIHFDRPEDARVFTDHLVPGIYVGRFQIIYQDGTTQTTVQKIAVIR